MKYIFLVIAFKLLIFSRLHSQEKTAFFFDVKNSKVIAKVKKGSRVRYLKISEIRDKRAKVLLVEDSFIITKTDTIAFSEINILSVKKIDFLKLGALLYCMGSSGYFFIRYPTIDAFNEARTFIKVLGISGLITNIPATVYLIFNPFKYTNLYLLNKEQISYKIIEE